MQISRLAFTLLLFCLLALNTSSLYATHVAGLSISYECVSNCTLRIHLTHYRDCSGTGLPDSSFIFLGSGGTCSNQPSLIPGTATHMITEVTPLCAAVLTQCSQPGASINGIEEHLFSYDYDFCSSNCNSYKLVVNRCCRDNGSPIPVNYWYLDQTEITSAGWTSCNSAPQFRQPPMFYFCSGQSQTFDMSAVDPDGDSLSYKLVAPKINSSQYWTYPSPNTYLQPFDSWNTSLDSVSGLLTLSPQPGNMAFGFYCIEVTEWRNGIKVGSVVRDVQGITVICNNEQAFISGTANLSGCTVSGDTIYAKTHLPFCLDILTDDPDAGQSQILTWDNGFPLGTFADSGNVLITDTITGIHPAGRFCAGAQTVPGKYRFQTRVHESGCQIAAGNYRHQVEWTIVIEDTNKVWPGDANDDLVADNNDLLVIGVYSGQAGYARPNASLSWTAQPSAHWPAWQAGGHNFNHADCNGDGIINASDTLAIITNYGMIHNKSGGSAAGGAPLSLAFPAGSFGPGDTVTAEIRLGSATDPVSAAYGIAFTLNYDPSVIVSGSVKINFTGGWIGNAANTLTLTKDFPTSGMQDAAIVRTDQQNTNGNGAIGTLTFVVGQNVIDGDMIPFGFSGISLIDKDQAFVPATAVADTLIIEDPLTATDTDIQAADVSIYPVPAQSMIRISSESDIYSVEITDLSGKLHLKKEVSGRNLQLDISSLNNGIYLLRLETAQGAVIKKVLISRQ